MDDGSGMIECNLRHNLVQLMSSASPRRSDTHALSKYHAARATTTTGSTPSSSFSSRGPSESPKPVAFVGDIVHIVGRVLNRHSTRIVNAEKIGTLSRSFPIQM